MSAVLVDVFAFGAFPVVANSLFIALPYMPLDHALVVSGLRTLSESRAGATVRLGGGVLFIACTVGSAVG
ncbi:hypothetical protein D3C78_1589840 [compost metagenome]